MQIPLMGSISRNKIEKQMTSLEYAQFIQSSAGGNNYCANSMNKKSGTSSGNSLFLIWESRV
jgi:hypothetical protein